MTKLPSVDHMIQAFANYFGDLYKLPAEVNSPAYKKAYAQLRDRLKGDFANAGIADRFSWEMQTAPKPKSKAAPAKPTPAKAETQTPAKVENKPANTVLLPEVKAGKTAPAFRPQPRFSFRGNPEPAANSIAGKAKQAKKEAEAQKLANKEAKKEAKANKLASASAKQTAAKAPAKVEAVKPAPAKTQTPAKKAVFKGSMFTKPRPAQVARHV